MSYLSMYSIFDFGGGDEQGKSVCLFPQSNLMGVKTVPLSESPSAQVCPVFESTRTLPMGAGTCTSWYRPSPSSAKAMPGNNKSAASKIRIPNSSSIDRKSARPVS